MAGSGLRGLGLALLVGCAAAVAACGGEEDSDTVVIEPNEPVQIRTLLSLTGAPSLAEPTRYGIEMAVRDFHSVHGHRIELGEPIDSMCSPEGGRAGAERVVADARVLGVVGTSCSGAAVAASPVLSEAGLAMISPSNTSPALTSDLAGNPGSDYHPGYFRVSNNDLYQARAVAGFAYNELGLRRIAAVHDGDAYTTAVVSAFGDAFGAVGGEVAATAQIEKGDTDMTAVLAEFAAAGPDGIFLPLFLAEGSPFAAQAREFDGLEGATLIAGIGDTRSRVSGGAAVGRRLLRGAAGGPRLERQRRDGQERGSRARGVRGCLRRALPLPPTGRTLTTRRRCCSPPSSASQFETTGTS